MRKLVVLTALVASFGVTGGTSTAQADNAVRKCPGVIKGVNYYRQATWGWQDKLGVHRTRAAHRSFQSCKFARWTARLWMHRARVYRLKFEAHIAWLHKVNSDPKAAICYSFGRYCQQAISVSYCETGGTFYVGASNGQYQGLFQMGEHERATYGHGPDALTQSRAAYSYFAATGYDWSPWECKP